MFELFERHATIVVAGAEALRGLLRGGEGIEYYCRQIFDREAEADEITRQVLTAVRRTFITPSIALTSRTSSPRWTTPSTR